MNTVIEALMLSAIGLLQGYILTRIDSMDTRLDTMRDEIKGLPWDMQYLKAHQRTRKDDRIQAE